MQHELNKTNANTIMLKFFSLFQKSRHVILKKKKNKIYILRKIQINFDLRKI